MRWRYTLILAVFVIPLVLDVSGQASSGNRDAPDWAAPATMTVKQVSYTTGSQREPNLLNNLDCSLVDYRVTGSSSTQSGCFTNSAFGLIDSDSDTVIFNGTDEGLPLLPYSAHQVLTPWPESGGLLALDAAQVSGSYLSLYKNPLSSLKDLRNAFGQLNAKQLTRPPDMRLNGPSGQPLVVNPQTLAFSDGGSWMVTEDLNGSFIRINLATLDKLPFAPAYGSTGSPALLHSQVTISQDGRYVAINNEAAGVFKVYD